MIKRERRRQTGSLRANRPMKDVCGSVNPQRKEATHSPPFGSRKQLLMEVARNTQLNRGRAGGPLRLKTGRTQDFTCICCPTHPRLMALFWPGVVINPLYKLLHLTWMGGRDCHDGMLHVIAHAPIACYKMEYHSTWCYQCYAWRIPRTRST